MATSVNFIPVIQKGIAKAIERHFDELLEETLLTMKNKILSKKAEIIGHVIVEVQSHADPQQYNKEVLLLGLEKYLSSNE